MSNSIWKTPGFHEAIDNKLKVSKDGKWIYWSIHGWNIPGEDVHDIGVEWAYVEDVLAQADKAERLQKAVDYALQVLGNVSEIGGIDKDLKIATNALEKYADEDMWETGHRWEVDYIQALFLEHGYEIAKEALEQINRKQD